MDSAPHTRPIVSIIAALDDNGLIGNGNALPWKLPADLQYFKRVTMGKPLLMGRRTHESIGRALPGRTNVVITRDPDYEAEGCVVVHSLDEALQAAGHVDEVMVMGGAMLYQQALPVAERLYLTRIHAQFEGDTWFPQMEAVQWVEVQRTDCPPDDKNAYPYSFVVYERCAG